jgi:DNA-binding LacI/PurR family transcriptional regulator
MTVSRALSGRGSVAAGTRERVLAAAQRLRYEPNLHARGLVSGQGQGIALFSMLLLPGGSARIIEKLRCALNGLGFDAPLHGFGARDWVDNPERQIELVRALLRTRPRAVICHTSSMKREALNELSRFIESGGVVIGFGQEADLPCDQVNLDYSGMVQRATSYLLELGHRDIGYYDPALPSLIDTASDGFFKALAEAHIQERKEWLWVGPMYEEGGVWLAERFLAASERPTAIVCAMDATASVFSHQVARAGVKVPDDVSVIGMNGLPGSEFLHPALTVINQPYDELAQLVVDMLQRRLADDDSPPRRVRIAGDLVPRESTAPPGGRS